MKPLTKTLFSILNLVLVLIPIMVFSQQKQGWRTGEMETTTLITNPEQATILHQLKINADMPVTIPGEARLYIIPEEQKELTAKGITTHVVIGDLNAHFAGWWNRDVPPGYYTYQQIIDIADSLTNAYPNICQKVILGYSIGGLQLAALKISDNVTIDEPEPELMFEAGIHGDEIGGAENLIRFARDLCKGYNINTSITNMIDTRETWLWLMVNPDGRQAMSRYNDNLVDINRDGGYMWNGEGNSPAAWSQVETRAMRDFSAGNQFVVFTDYHSGTEYISYPWSYRADFAPDKPHMNQLASVYSTVSGYNNLTYAQGFSGMYPINGSTKDYNYGSNGSISWSIEISVQKQPSAGSINSIYLRNKPAMMALIEKSGLGIQGTITDSLSGMPIPAIIWINNYYPCYNDPTVGDYHKYLLGGSYDVKITASGYETKGYEGISIPDNGVLNLNASLIRSTDTGFARRVLGCYILNNNPNDEGYTPGSLGEPDNINYSLGKNGWVIVDMGDTIVNKPGNDISVIESDGTNEGYTLYAGTTPDGPWVSLGEATGSDEFDLGTTFSKVRYLKIKDSGTGGTTFPDAGFDVDAVANLHPATRSLFKATDTLFCSNQSTTFTDLSRGEPLTWLWQFEGGTPSFSTEQNPTVSYHSPGIFKVTLTIADEYTTASSTRNNYINVLPLPIVDLGTDTLICFDYQQVTLDAGNPGANYLWNTGETTQSIETQCFGIDTINNYSVLVTLSNGCTQTDTIGVMCTICEGIDKASTPFSIIYPNPARDNVTVRTEQSNTSAIELTDLLGRILLVVSNPMNETILDLSAYTPGVYILKIIGHEVPDQITKVLKL